MNDMSRRTFVGFVAATAVCAGVGGSGVLFGGDGGGLLRPPGAQDEDGLLSACVKCDRCRSVCPTGVIGVADLEDGFLRARTPILDFHQGICDFCGKCQDVCMTGAIRSFDPDTDKIGVAIIQTDRCLAYVESCTECVEACPYEAISLDGSEHPIVDAEACNGCGECENICPALVYRSFAGGTRRGVVVVPYEEYESIGSTSVDGGDEA